MKNICASCVGVDVTKIIKTDNEKLPLWLKNKNYVDNFIQDSKIKLYKQKKTNMKLKLDLGKTKINKYVLYWAAESSHQVLIKDAKQAYNNFKNYGVAKVDKNGHVVLHFNCPQPYSTVEKGKRNPETFYRHIHFCFSNSNNTKWLDSVYTKIVICEINLKNTMAMKDQVVLINSLPSQYYAKSHIPNSYNLNSKTIKKMSQVELFNWFQEVIDINYPKLAKLVKQKKINIYELPIIVYCAHSECNSSHLAAIELLKKGFVNISKFEGGMKEYLKKK